ncbi:MAG: glycerol-3-phosphate 1-O-acyltransferase PlsY [Planctomycetota bacterium]|nr:glycerol-3-phosphate 1-O-acyltransferase PlsY [Planctomycetota bacterium]
MAFISMGTPTAEILLAVAAYLIGGIPFGWIMARTFKGVDLRKVGSGGVGATNCARQWSGWRSIAMFVVVFALDFGKGLFVALFSVEAAAAVGRVLDSESTGLALQVITGTAAIFGHVFTPYLRFRGGKGVATMFGVVTALAPLSSLAGLGAWGMILGITRYMSMGSIAAMVMMPLSYWLDNGADTFHARFVVFAFLLVMAGFVVWSHRSNIQRVLRGTERRVGDADQKL